MSNISQSLKSDFLAGQWVLVVIVSTEYFDFLELSSSEFHFDKLPFPFRLNHFTSDFEGVVHLGFLDFLPVGYCVLDDDLDGFSRRAVN